MPLPVHATKGAGFAIDHENNLETEAVAGRCRAVLYSGTISIAFESLF
jgi:hypothetical protein